MRLNENILSFYTPCLHPMDLADVTRRESHGGFRLVELEHGEPVTKARLAPGDGLILLRPSSPMHAPVS